MRIGKYNLHFTPTIQAEFVNQNEEELIQDIKSRLKGIKNPRDVLDHACWDVSGEIYDNHGISIDVGLLTKLDILGE